MWLTREICASHLLRKHLCTLDAEGLLNSHPGMTEPLFEQGWSMCCSSALWKWLQQPRRHWVSSNTENK